MTATRDTAHHPHPLTVLHDCERLRRAIAKQQAVAVDMLDTRILPLLQSTVDALASSAVDQYGPEYRDAFAAEAARLRAMAAGLRVVRTAYHATISELCPKGADRD